MHIRLCKEIALFDISRTEEVDKALNVAKSFIYKCRFLKSIPTVNKFMPFLKSRYIVE